MRNVIARAAIAITALVGMEGCAHGEPLAEHAAVQFAVAPTPIVRVGETRVLARHLNLRRAVLVGVDEGFVTVTFAERARAGVIMSVDPVSLALHGTRQFVYPSDPPKTSPTFTDLQPSTVALAHGRFLTCMTVEDRVALSDSQVLSESGVVGSPMAATVDGRRVVVVFVVARDTGFELVAVALDTQAS